MVWSAEFFTQAEFVCACCGKGADLICPRLLLVADEVRRRLGPLKINSGYRCPEHNLEIGSNNASQHIKGKAADFTLARAADRENPVNILRLYITLEEVGRRHLGSGFGIGLYNSFVHFDTRNGAARWCEFDWPRR